MTHKNMRLVATTQDNDVKMRHHIDKTYTKQPYDFEKNVFNGYVTAND